MPARGSFAVIVNAAAGAARGRAELATELRDLFKAAGGDADVVVLGEGERPEAAARTAVRAGASTVVAGGGDGTISSVAGALAGSGVALGILPLGTLNHFAKDLGIPGDLRQAVEVIVAGHRRSVDVGEVNDHVFVNNASIGIYPNIVEEREALRRRGHRKWPAMALATFRVLARYRGVRVLLEAEGRQRTWQTPFVFVGNNEYAIEGIGLGGRASLDRGELFVYLTPRARTRDLPLLVAKALAGRASQSGAFEMVQATELVIDMLRPRLVQVAVDGEVMTMRTPLRFRARPRALPVVVPRP